MSGDKSSNGGVERLDVTRAEGLWAVRSESTTVYYVDLDRGRLLRARGAGSQRFDFDDEWVKLVQVSSRDELSGTVQNGEVRVGARPRYLTDPLPTALSYQWRLQREVTSIERVTEEEADALRERTPEGSDSP